VWDNPIVTVTADERKRIILAQARPGQRFDVQVSGDGVFLVRRLEPVQPVKLVRARKINGKWMGADVKMDRQAVVDSIREDRESR
jgi:hypothetical protein